MPIRSQHFSRALGDLLDFDKKHDTVVPIAQSQKLAESLGVKVNVVEGADHGYKEPEQSEEMQKLIVDFASFII